MTGEATHELICLYCKKTSDLYSKSLTDEDKSAIYTDLKALESVIDSMVGLR